MPTPARRAKLTPIKVGEGCASHTFARDNYVRNSQELAMLSDIEIAQKTKMKRISEVATKLGIPDEATEPFGRYKAKVSLDYINTLKNKPDGKLILVTAISPTPAGEGKT